MELIILLLIIIVVIFVFKKFENVVYVIGIIDLLLRIITEIKKRITSPELEKFFNSYVPESIPTIISKYTGGVINEILLWAYLIMLIIFVYYLIRYFIRKKK